MHVVALFEISPATLILANHFDLFEALHERFTQSFTLYEHGLVFRCIVWSAIPLIHHGNATSSKFAEA